MERQATAHVVAPIPGNARGRLSGSQRLKTVVLAVPSLLLLAGFSLAHDPASPQWHPVDAPGQPRLLLCFFWAPTCPHCKEALPFLHSLSATSPWLQIASLELTEHPENVARYIAMARALGQEATAVPAFMFCQERLVGYATADTTGEVLRSQLLECYQHWRVIPERQPASLASPSAPISLPWGGYRDPAVTSLPVVTLVLVGLDALNPWAFFVLLFLLSLLGPAHSRWRMLLIGGIFVVCSGVLYFVFMAAWLNGFLLAGHLRSVTVIAGLLALLMTLLNIKEAFRLRYGPSLTIPAQAKLGLFARMCNLVRATSLPPMLLGTVTLAVVANTYAFLCTAGFPMVSTRLLTLQGLAPSADYGYLAVYNVMDVMPLAVIVGICTATLGRCANVARRRRTASHTAFRCHDACSQPGTLARSDVAKPPHDGRKCFRNGPCRHRPNDLDRTLVHAAFWARTKSPVTGALAKGESRC